MTRIFGVFGAVAVTLAALGCGTEQVTKPDPSVRVAAELPPSAETWPRYPSFPKASCWTRTIPGLGTKPLQAAPSFAVSPRPSPVSPARIRARILARFGDRRYVRSISFGSPPKVTLMHLRGYFAGVRPPQNAVWAYVNVRPANDALLTHPTPRQAETQMIAEWEQRLVVGALRDDFCAAGGAPLVGWSVGQGSFQVSDRTQALEQRFPNPSATAFRRRVKLIGRRYGFTVQELRLLRPRQLAPLLIVRTTRDRKAFVRDVPAMMQLLDPINSHTRQPAITFEGFFLEASDNKGPFMRIENHYRGETEGGEWSWNRCVSPYPHSEPFGAKPCP